MTDEHSEWTSVQDKALLKQLGGVRVARKLLNCRSVTVEFGRDCAVLKGSLRAHGKNHLRRERMFTLPEHADVFNPREFFKTSDGLLVREDFRTCILPVTRTVQSLPAMDIVSFDVRIQGNDLDIRSELLEGHEFEANEFCAHCSGLIKRRLSGEKGFLVEDGCSNVFYVFGKSGELFAVVLTYLTPTDLFLVDAKVLHDYTWVAGHRVFSRIP